MTEVTCPGEPELPGSCKAGRCWGVLLIGGKACCEFEGILKVCANAFVCFLLCLAKRNIVGHMHRTTPIIILRTQQGHVGVLEGEHQGFC